MPATLPRQPFAHLNRPTLFYIGLALLWAFILLAPQHAFAATGNYHSRTYRYNVVYRADLMAKAVKWADWLEARFVTFDITKSGAPSMTPTVQPVPEKTEATIPAAAQVHQPLKTVSWNTSGYVPRKISFNDRP